MSDDAEHSDAAKKKPEPRPRVVIHLDLKDRLAFSMHEAAAVLGCSYITVHRLLKRGLIRASTATRTKIIARSELERFLRETSKS